MWSHVFSPSLSLFFFFFYSLFFFPPPFFSFFFFFSRKGKRRLCVSAPPLSCHPSPYLWPFRRVERQHSWHSLLSSPAGVLKTKGENIPGLLSTALCSWSRAIWCVFVCSFVRFFSLFVFSPYIPFRVYVLPGTSLLLSFVYTWYI